MTTPAPRSGPGGLAHFNILHGFTEALVRGMRNSFLSDADYHHMSQCETLEDVKLNLSESDYAEAVADMGSLTPNVLQKAAIEKVRSAGTLLLLRPMPLSGMTMGKCKATGCSKPLRYRQSVHQQCAGAMSLVLPLLLQRWRRD